MPLKEYITTPLVPEQYYHIYNRGNAGTRLFYQEKNYKYFLKKYFAYSHNYWDTYAYCLLPDHFHFLIRPKPLHMILDNAEIDFQYASKTFLNSQKLASPNISMTIKSLRNTDSFEIPLTQWILSERIRRLMLGYAKSINKQQRRYGSLFQKLFRRKCISQSDCPKLVQYIHRNPVHHGYCRYPGDYEWSSYNSILLNKSSGINDEITIGWFGDKEEYARAHTSYVTDWHLIGRYQRYE